MGLSIVQKLDGILEYCQTSSSDLTLPDLKDDEKPSSYARKDLIEVEQKTKELLEAAKDLLIYEYGNGGELQVDNIEAMPDEFKRLYEATKAAESDNNA